MIACEVGGVELFNALWDDYQHVTRSLTGQLETNPEQLRDVIQAIIAVGSSLRLQNDVDRLLKNIALAACKSLRFRFSALYLVDDEGCFRVRATAGVSQADEAYLHEHPLPGYVAAMLIQDEYRISDSYFLPAEAPIWRDPEFASFFVTIDEREYAGGGTHALNPVVPRVAPSESAEAWLPEDMLVVPLVSADNMLLGLLTPDAPLNGLRPTVEIMALFELFANQAAVAIEGARLYADLRDAVRQAQESEQIKNQFLMTASHELRTPLTAIQGYLELLSSYHETLDENTKKRFMQNARRACDELVLLLGNVMDTSRIEEDRVLLKMTPMKTTYAVKIILEILEPIITRENRCVRIAVAEEDIVWVDELRLRQVLLNLVGNALKYSPEGTDLEIRTERLSWSILYERIPTLKRQIPIPSSGQFVVIAIRDWGPGISPEDQPQLFNKFVRLSGAINSMQRGAGLGLYLCRQLIEAMGGHIWLESAGAAGEGSTFFVALPLLRDA